MEFELGDKVVGVPGNPGSYGITKEGNGYGIVLEVCAKNIRVDWVTLGGKHEAFYVNPKYFVLADEPKSALAPAICKFYGIDVMTLKTNTGENMELNEISKENLLEAQKKFDAEKANAEVEYALKTLRSVQSQRNSIQTQMINLQSQLKKLDEQLSPFKTVKSARKARKKPVL